MNVYGGPPTSSEIQQRPAGTFPPEVRQDPDFHRAAGQDGYRDGCRVPIPWSGDQATYGFGPDGGGSWLHQPYSWAGLSGAAQAGVAGSTLELYRSALAIRRTNPALAPHRQRPVGVRARRVLAFEVRSRALRSSAARST